MIDREVLGMTAVAMLITCAIGFAAVGWAFLWLAVLGEGVFGWSVALGGIIVGSTLAIAWAESNR